MGKVLNKRNLIDGLIKELFIVETSEETDDGDASASASARGTSKWKLNSNVSMALTFMFPQIYLKAIEILDLGRIVIYQYAKESEDTIDSKVDSFMENGDYLVICQREGEEEEEEGISPMIDLDQWFCSCPMYQEQFEHAEFIEDITLANDSKYGHRFGLHCQFKQQMNSAHDIPICEHLLAHYILSQHYEKLPQGYTLKPVDLPQWLELHSMILPPCTP